ncbi:MAG: chemotaxis protein CheX [Polyangiaceae bacterium]|nr:chemotaxis protein CheX [Polyangiaceae bacterium]
MFGTNVSVGGAMRAMAATACEELFAAYGVSLRVSSDSNRPFDQIVLCGVLGFTGSQLRGSVLLAGTEGPFAVSRPAQGQVRDWVGELTNQLVGRLKNRLRERGAEIAPSTPVVLQGEHIAPLPRHLLIPLMFDCDQGVVLVWVHVETTPGFELMPAADGREDAGTPRDEAIFF